MYVVQVYDVKINPDEKPHMVTPFGYYDNLADANTRFLELFGAGDGHTAFRIVEVK